MAPVLQPSGCWLPQANVLVSTLGKLLTAHHLQPRFDLLLVSVLLVYIWLQLGSCRLQVLILDGRLLV